MAETKTSFFILACYAVVARCCRYLARCYLSKNKSQKHSNNISIRRKFFDSEFLKPPPPEKTRCGQRKIWGRVVAQLTARSLPIPEDPGSNPVIVNIVNCLLKDENKEKEAGIIKNPTTMNICSNVHGK